MANKNLKEKISRTKNTFIIGTLAYIVLGLLLLNDYSYDAHFDPKKIYDVFKDGLTLSAAFLAPVAAFVLYGEWRASHRMIKNEQLIESLHIDIRDLNYKLSALVFDLTHQRKQNEEDVMAIYKSDLKNLNEKQFRVLSEIERIKSKFDNQDFFNLAKEYLNQCYFLIKDAEKFVACNSEYNNTKTIESLGDRLNAYNKLMESRTEFELNAYDSVVSIRVAADKYYI